MTCDITNVFGGEYAKSISTTTDHTSEASDAHPEVMTSRPTDHRMIRCLAITTFEPDAVERTVNA